MTDRTTIPFNLRPDTFAALESEARGNKSFAVRRMLSEYLAAPYDLDMDKDNLVKTSFSTDSALAEKLKERASEMGVSSMALVRLVVEHKLNKEQ